MTVFRQADHLLAGAKAHAHLAINAAGMFGRRLQVFMAAPHLKQVATSGLEFLGSRAGAERSVVESRRAADARGHAAAREGIIQNDLHVGRESQAQQLQVRLGEMEARELI